ncbi:MAG: DUF5610 domain-containing protein [Candidatus Latescibacteria bacterium]|nr:DUF5610 domain-containing protein [Candidatus Latescibacterota bacterium]
MPIRSDIANQALVGQYRADRSNPRGGAKRPDPSVSDAARPDRTDAQARTQAAPSSQQVDPASDDRVEISLAANLTVEAVNGILNDSVVEQINKAIQEAGIDLKVEDVEASGTDSSPEATARRITDHSVAFLDRFAQGHQDLSAKARIEGFMSLIRDAIEVGFKQAREVLAGVTKLSDTIDQNISKTLELTHQYLDRFHQTQVEQIQAAGEENALAPTGG